MFRVLISSRTKHRWTWLRWSSPAVSHIWNWPMMKHQHKNYYRRNPSRARDITVTRKFTNESEGSQCTISYCILLKYDSIILHPEQSEYQKNEAISIPPYKLKKINEYIEKLVQSWESYAFTKHNPPKIPLSSKTLRKN